MASLSSKCIRRLSTASLISRRTTTARMRIRAFWLVSRATPPCSRARDALTSLGVCLYGFPVEFRRFGPPR
jgi:hypothetical protein